MKYVYFLLILINSVHAKDLRGIHHSKCDVCIDLYAEMRHAVMKNTSLYMVDNYELFKTYARTYCHEHYHDKGKKHCINMSDDNMHIIKYLYDIKPSGCEKSGYCNKCIECGYGCMQCQDTDAGTTMVARINMKLNDFMEWWNM